MNPTAETPESVWLVAAPAEDVSPAAAEDSLRELASLARTAGATVAGQSVFRLRRLNPASYIGPGHAAALAADVAAAHADTVVFDEDLSPAQGRALEQTVGVRVVDRTQLILDIFAQRARSVEGRLQIELAQLRYLLPRLRGLWTHLERQKGGIGLKGPGEKQLELDRRRIEERISRLRERLALVRSRRERLRSARRRHGWALVTLVGYTNAGKSTLLNRLADASVLADDLLFATLDPTTRQISLPNHVPCLLTDTVGFIRKLPHHLVEAFKATLEEVSEADLLLHVVDASHSLAEDQVRAVNDVLRDLGADTKPVIAVFNKTDLEAGTRQLARLQELFDRSVPLSARTGDGVTRLLDMVCDALRNRALTLRLSVPATDGRFLARLHSVGRILRQRLYATRLHLDVVLPPSFLPSIPPSYLR